MQGKIRVSAGAWGRSLIALAYVCAPSAPASAQDLQEQTMILAGGRTRTFIIYKEKRYQKIKPEEMDSLRYSGQQVCFEIKFDSRIKGRDAFKAIGSEKLDITFRTRAQRSQIDGLIPGDNVWVGGWARRKGRTRICLLEMEETLKLKSDRQLFSERYRRYYAKEHNWKKLIELGKAIERSSRLAPTTGSRDMKIYGRLKRRAFKGALDIRRRTLKPDDANGHYETAMMYLDLTNDRFMAKDMLRKCARINPRHAMATAKLREFGYVQYDGSWVKPEARARLIEEKRKAQERSQAEKHEQERIERERKERERLAADQKKQAERTRLRLALRSRAAPPLAAYERAIQYDDDRLGRLVIHRLAAVGSQRSFDTLSRLADSKHPDVRKDLADALAFKGDPKARDLLVRIGEFDPDASTRAHAIYALQWIGDADAVGRLIALLKAKSPGTPALTAAALKDLTDKSFDARPEPWQTWWRDAEPDYKAPARD